VVFAAALIEGDGSLGMSNVRVPRPSFTYTTHWKGGLRWPSRFQPCSCLCRRDPGSCQSWRPWGPRIQFHHADDDGCVAGSIGVAAAAGAAGLAGAGCSSAPSFLPHRRGGQVPTRLPSPNCYRSIRFHVFAVPLLKFESSKRLKIYSGAPRQYCRRFRAGRRAAGRGRRMTHGSTYSSLLLGVSCRM